MNCPKCGTENSDELLYCKKCGAGLKGGPDAVTVANRNSMNTIGGLYSDQIYANDSGTYNEQAASYANKDINLAGIDFNSQNTIHNADTAFNNLSYQYSVKSGECSGVMRRFIALLIDYTILFFSVHCIIRLSGIKLLQFTKTTVINIFVYRQYIIIGAIALSAAAIFCAVLECSPLRGTLGKAALGCIAADKYGNRISFLRALVRNIFKFIVSIIVNSLILLLLSPLFTLLILLNKLIALLIYSYILFFASYTLALFTSKKQALHDLIAGTVILLK